MNTRHRSLRATIAMALACASLAACTGSAPSPSPSTPGLPSVAPLASGVSPATCAPDQLARPAHAALTLLGPDDYRVGGWNHITGVGSFSSVALPVGDYRIEGERYQADPQCGDARTLPVVLVKKTYDWDRQHANGMESVFPNGGVTFGDVTDVTLVFRLRPEATHIPTAETLAAAYGDLLSPDQLSQLDAGRINLELTLFGTGATADQPFMNAGTIVDVDPAAAADGWVRVTVTRDDLTFYTEDNYVRTEVGPDAHQDLRIQGLRINPETAGGLTVRHFVQDDFDPTAALEVFKEMGLTFALIEVGRTAAEDDA